MKRNQEEPDFVCKKCKLEYTKDEKFINYVSQPPPLQNIALVSIAISLWTEPDVIKELKTYCFEIKYNQGTKSGYKKLEGKVLKLLSEMCLPKSLKLEVSHAMRPIVLQLLRCFDYRDEEYHLFYNLLKVKGSVYWTMEGTIDKPRCLKELINGGYELKNLKQLFYLSCLYCLEECVVELWHRLSDVEREEMFEENQVKIKYHIVLYWAAVLRNELHSLFSRILFVDFVSTYGAGFSVYQNMVSLSVYVGNSIAFKYFWYKLTAQEKASYVDKWLVQIVENSVHKNLHSRNLKFQEYYEFTDIMCFLLSNLSDEEQQKKFFRNYPCFVLKSLFFCWPFQRFFMPTITVMFDYLEKRKYVQIMSNIFNEIREGRINTLFREVWQCSPKMFRRTCIRFFNFYFVFRRLVWKLLSVGDIKTIFMVFDDSTSAEKHQLISNLMEDHKALFSVIYSNKLDLLDRVASKSLSSEDFNSLKHRLMLNEADSLFQRLTCKGAFQEAKRFLDWGFQSLEKVKEFKKNKVNPMEFLHRLMHGDCENLNQFMMWYFESENAVCKFKNSFILKMTFSNEWGILLLNFSRRCNSWEHFENFINWCMQNVYTSRKVSQLKKVFSKCVVSVLKVHNLDFATKLLNWCFDSTDEASLFKNKLVVSEEGINLFLLVLNPRTPDWERARDVVRWFSPLSSEVVLTLKTSLIKKRCDKNKLRYLCALIKSWDVNYDTCASMSNIKNKVLNNRVIDLTKDDCTETDDEDLNRSRFYRDAYYFI